MEKESQVTALQNFQTLEQTLLKIDSLMKDFQINRDIIKNLMSQLKVQVQQLEKIRNQEPGIGATQSGADDGKHHSFWRKNLDYGVR